MFFASNFLGATAVFGYRLYLHPLSKQNIGPTVQIAAIMCIVVALMSAYVLWMAQRRDAKAASLRPTY
jgi:ABC-type sulfate transport system permease component